MRSASVLRTGLTPFASSGVEDRLLNEIIASLGTQCKAHLSRDLANFRTAEMGFWAEEVSGSGAK
jgi:hypothetical protein